MNRQKTPRKGFHYTLEMYSPFNWQSSYVQLSHLSRRPLCVCVCVYSVAFFGARYLYSPYSLAALPTLEKLDTRYRTNSVTHKTRRYVEDVRWPTDVWFSGPPTKLYTFPMSKKSKYQNTAGKLSPSVESMSNRNA
jgi:hypothetical protein